MILERECSYMEVVGKILILPQNMCPYMEFSITMVKYFGFTSSIRSRGRQKFERISF